MHVFMIVEDILLNFWINPKENIIDYFHYFRYHIYISLLFNNWSFLFIMHEILICRKKKEESISYTIGLRLSLLFLNN